MFLQPIFNQDSNRPYRWALQEMESGDIIERYWTTEDHYTHWTEKSDYEERDIFSSFSSTIYNSFISMRRKNIGFLTTYHKEFYEDGKYTEVFNDPINYTLTDPTNYTEAFINAENRIGNYRKGVRRNIIHLGGTISEDELDMLEDNDGVQLSSLPLLPPIPTDFTKPFRTNLITSDVGYISYIKSAHNTETSTNRFAHKAEQGTGFRRFIYDAGNSNMMHESSVINSVSKVDIEDLETVIDTQLGTAIAGSTLSKKFLPDDGEDSSINFPGQHIIRSDKNGIHLEVYDDTSFTTLVSLIDIDKTTGDIYIGAGTTDISITANGSLVIDDGTRSITLGTSSIVLADGSRTITMNGSTVDIT